jgi:antitoxin FitA
MRLAMGQLLIRRIDEDVKEILRLRAKRHGVSMEEEARSILAVAVSNEAPQPQGLGSRIAARFRDIEGWDGVLPQIPDEPVRFVNFDE